MNFGMADDTGKSKLAHPELRRLYGTCRHHVAPQCLHAMLFGIEIASPCEARKVMQSGFSQFGQQNLNVPRERIEPSIVKVTA